jgi:hypothetical protein
MLFQGIGVGDATTETLAGLLGEIDDQHADWRLGNYQIFKQIERVKYWEIIADNLKKAG